MPLDFGEQELLVLTELFHQFQLQIANATQHESCVPRKTGQLLYWEIVKCLGDLENAIKVPEDVQRHQGFSMV
jgi:hypothetical protein